MSNKKIHLFGFMLFFGGFMLFHGTAFAIMVDGDLSDWGITPFTHWAPTLTGTSYALEDNSNRIWSDKFYEDYDIEAMYINDCKKYINFAVVSSFSYTGGGYNESLFRDFSGRTMDQILVKGDYKYALDLAGLPLGLSTKGVYEVNQDWVYTEKNHNGSPLILPVSVKMAFNPNGPNGYKFRDDGLQYHDLLGTYQVYNNFLGTIELGVTTGATYVLEGRIDKSLFAENLDCGAAVETYFSNVGCIKDWITVRDTLDGPCAIVPEPATVILFGFGGLAMAFLRRKNKGVRSIY